MKLFFAMLGVLLFACTERSDISVMTRIPIDAYYKNEIFDTDHIDIYGVWNYKSIGCGWSGEGVPEYSQLEIAKYGIYSVSNKGEILEYGKIEIIEQSDDLLYLRFIKKSGENHFLDEGNFQVSFNGDSLIFQDRVLDGCTRAYEKVKYFRKKFN